MPKLGQSLSRHWTVVCIQPSLHHISTRIRVTSQSHVSESTPITYDALPSTLLLNVDVINPRVKKAPTPSSRHLPLITKTTSWKLSRTSCSNLSKQSSIQSSLQPWLLQQIPLSPLTPKRPSPPTAAIETPQASKPPTQPAMASPCLTRMRPSELERVDLSCCRIST